MSYPMPRAIAGAAEATRARPMIVATLINVATMSSSHAPASNARAIALRQSASGAPSATTALIRTSASALGSSAANRASPSHSAAVEALVAGRAPIEQVPFAFHAEPHKRRSAFVLRRFERIRSAPATSRWHEIGGAERSTSRAARSRGAARSLRRAKRPPASDRSRSPGTSPCSARGGAARRPAGT